MENKGFTMVELLAIITVLATILLVGFSTLINMTRRDKVRKYNDLEKTLCKAGETYIYNNKELYPELGNVGETFYVDIQILIDNNLVNKSQKNPKDNTPISGNIKYTVNSDKSLKCYFDGSMGIPGMLAKSKKDGEFINTGINSKKISSLDIHKTINIPDGYESKDCSYNQDKSVMCYWRKIGTNLDYYELHIAANGEIYTPYDSKNLFSYFGYDNLQELNLEGINTKYTKNMKRMFDNAGYTEMTNLNLGSKFNTSNVIDMYGMFNMTGYTSMLQLDLGNNFNTINVTNMRYMFRSAGYIAMTNLDLGNKFDTSKVNSMEGMFNSTGYTSMTDLNLGDKFNTSNVTDMSNMFNSTGYIAMTNLSLGDKFNTSNVTDMSEMFNRTGNNSMTALDLKDGFDTSKVISMYQMFNGTGYEKMTSLKLGKKFIISDSTVTQEMFLDCGKSTVLTEVIVPSELIKEKVLNLAPSWWNTNNIIKVQP